jgi:uncharacterized protein YukE
MSDKLSKRYAEYFDRTLATIAEYGSRIGILAWAVVLITLGLVFVVAGPEYALDLREPVGQARLWIYIYVLLLTVLTGFAFNGARIALDRLKRAHEGLRSIAKRLEKDSTRDAFLDDVRKEISPNDENVPEAILSMANAERSSEVVHAAAGQVTAPAESQLANLVFMRTALVLAGLFGTVLFFAVQLGIIQTGAHQEITSLKAALLSSLTGILGAIAISWVSSWLESVLDTTQWETEAFFAGVVAPVLARRPEEQPIESERMLWESMRTAVNRMTNQVVDHYDQMVAQGREFSEVLRAVSQQLRETPAMVLPPALERIGEAGEQLASSAQTMDRLVPPLVEAVSRIGVHLPAEVLDRLAEIKKRLVQTEETVGESRKEMKGSLVELARVTAGLTSNLDRLPSDLSGQLGRIESATGLSLISAGELRESFGELDRHLSREMDTVAHGVVGLPTIANRIDEAAGTLRQTSEELRAVVPDMQDGARGIGEATQVLNKRSGDIVALRRWCEVIVSAPLMRAILFLGGRRLEDVTGDENKA